jgi:hypothetical protein
VWYSTGVELGRPLREGEPGWQAGKEIYTGGLPPETQHLWALYQPALRGAFDSGVDFTWEREWRVKPRKPEGLPIFSPFHLSPGLRGAILVERDADVGPVRAGVESLAPGDARWGDYLTRIVSLETARRWSGGRDTRYLRLDDWPFE